MCWPQDTTAATAASPQTREHPRRRLDAEAAARQSRAALLLAPLALLAACATPGPATERSTLLAPATLAAGDATSSATAVAPAPDWWRALGDVQLRVCRDTGQNPT